MSDIMQKNIQQNALSSQDILKSLRDNASVHKPKNSALRQTEFSKIMQHKPPVLLQNNPKIMSKSVINLPVHDKIANTQSVKHKQKESVSDVKTDEIQSKSPNKTDKTDKTDKTESVNAHNKTEQDTSVQDSVAKILKDKNLSMQEKIQILAQNTDIQSMSNAEKTDFFTHIIENNPDIQHELFDFFTETESTELSDINTDTDKNTEKTDITDMMAVLGYALVPFTDKIAEPSSDINTDTTAIPNTAADITDQAISQSPESIVKNSDKTADNNPALENMPVHTPSVTMDKHHVTEKISFSQVFAKIPAENNTTIILTRSKDNPEQIGINLEPAGMGNADLIIENKDNVVTAIIRADRPETLDLIRKESASLEKHLSESGINLGGAGLQFQQRTSDNNDKNNQTTQSVSMGGVSDSRPHGETSPADSISVYQTILNINPSQGVDVRL